MFLSKKSLITNTMLPVAANAPERIDDLGLAFTSAVADGDIVTVRTGMKRHIPTGRFDAKPWESPSTFAFAMAEACGGKILRAKAEDGEYVATLVFD